MDHSIAIPALVAFFITLILGPGLISFLHKLKFGQFIREEGPESHLKKSGTPTMGGVVFIIATVIAASVFRRKRMASRNFIYSGVIRCCAWNSEWSELYRWT